MPLTERNDDAFGGTVVTLTPPDGLDVLPEPLRDALPEALVRAFENPEDRLAHAIKQVPLPGFAAWAERLTSLPRTVEIAYDSFAHDDDARLVFGAWRGEDAAKVEADTGADELPAPPPLPELDLSDLDAAMPEGAISPETKAQMQALGAKMQRALQPARAVGEASAEAAALSFVPPVVLDAPPLLQAVYEAVGTIRLGPPGSSAGLVAAQPADYRLEMADPDYLAVFETGTGDVLATTEDGSEAVWLRADDAGETPIPAGSLAKALDALFVALAEGQMPGLPGETAE